MIDSDLDQLLRLHHTDWNMHRGIMQSGWWIQGIISTRLRQNPDRESKSVLIICDDPLSDRREQTELDRLQAYAHTPRTPFHLPATVTWSDSSEEALATITIDDDATINQSNNRANEGEQYGSPSPNSGASKECLPADSECTECTTRNPESAAEAASNPEHGQTRNPPRIPGQLSGAKQTPSRGTGQPAGTQETAKDSQTEVSEHYPGGDPRQIPADSCGDDDRHGSGRGSEAERAGLLESEPYSRTRLHADSKFLHWAGDSSGFFRGLATANGEIENFGITQFWNCTHENCPRRLNVITDAFCYACRAPRPNLHGILGEAEAPRAPLKSEIKTCPNCGSQLRVAAIDVNHEGASEPIIRCALCLVRLTE